jgi:hypothetical protein
MTQQVINTGIQGNDGTGDSIRDSFIKVNQNFTELYAVFGQGGTLKLSGLGDGTTYTANQLIAASNDGTKLSARTLTSNGLTSGGSINIIHTSGGIDISTAANKLQTDQTPTLRYPMDANGQPIADIPDPSATLISNFKTNYPSSVIGSINSLPVTVNYGVNNFVAGVASNISTVYAPGSSSITTTKAGTYSVSAVIKSRAQPTSPQTGDSDYNANLTSNYLATEVMQRKDVVYRGGDTMTGALNLNDHPSPLAGAGIVNSNEDLQAATKYYVDNNTSYSNVNLYVNTSGDDNQTNTPPGREGRAPQYAYKTIGTAAFAADTLINAAQLEPGPYRQTISYTQGGVQTKSLTHNPAVLSGGNSAMQTYLDADFLLNQNKSYIQQETIAYLNKKYVNALSITDTTWNTIFNNLISGVAYDLAQGGNFNSITGATTLLTNPSYASIISNSLAQLTDGVSYAATQVVDLSYDKTKLSTYITQVLTAVQYDLLLQSNFQSIQAGLQWQYAGVTLSNTNIVTELSIIAGKIKANISGFDTFINGLLGQNADGTYGVIPSIILTGTIPTLKLPASAATVGGSTSARDLLLNNIPFIQAELIDYIKVNYPGLNLNTATTKLNIEYITWSLCYDLMYGGNQQSVYAGAEYWIGGTLSLNSSTQSAYAAAVGYLNTLVQNIIINSQLGVATGTILYQQSIIQYTNSTLTGGSVASASLAANISTIQSIINSSSYSQVTGVAITYPTTPSTGSLYNAQQTINGLATGWQSSTAVAANISGFDSSVLDLTLNNTVNNLFGGISTLLSGGLTNRSHPSYVTTGIPSGYSTAITTITTPQNLNFIATDAYLHVGGGTTFTPAQGGTSFINSIIYLLEAISYDLCYGGNSATITAANNIISNFTGTVNATSEQVSTNTAIQWAAGLVNSLISGSTSVTGISGNPYTPVFGGNAGSGATSAVNALFVIAKNLVTAASTYTTVPPTNGGNSVILANATSISTSTVNYLKATYVGGFSYNQATCLRDIGLIVDAMRIDLLTGGNYQSVNAGKSYYRNSSAKSVAIGTQYTETLDGLKFAQGVIDRVLSQTSATPYSTTSQYTNGTKSATQTVINTLNANYNAMIGIITNGIATAPSATPGTGIYTLQFTNGSNGYVDQGAPGDVHILPAKILIGNTSGAQAVIVSYTPGSTSQYDTITLRMLQPGFFIDGETLDFAETVGNINITILVESGIYYEDYPIKIPTNVTIKGDDFRRTIIRPLDRVSQSPWRRSFFFRNSIIDGLLLGQVNFPAFNLGGIDSATSTSLTLSAAAGNITATLGSGVASPSWVGLVVTDAVANFTGYISGTTLNVSSTISGSVTVGMYITGAGIPVGTVILSGTAGTYTINNSVSLGSNGSPFTIVGNTGTAIVNSVAGNVLYLTVITSFTSAEVANTLSSGNWHLFSTIDYGYHYLTDPTNFYSTAKNNKEIDVFLCNDATRIKLITGQGHGGFMMVLDPNGQIKTKSPYGQECGSFSGSTNSHRFAGGQFIDGFVGRLNGNVTAVDSTGQYVTVTGYAGSGLDVRPPQVPCSFFVQGKRYQINDLSPNTYTQNSVKVTVAYSSGGSAGTSSFVVSQSTDPTSGVAITSGMLVTGTGVQPYTYVAPGYTGGTTIPLTTPLSSQATGAGNYTFGLPQVTLVLDSSTLFNPIGAFDNNSTTYALLTNQLGVSSSTALYPLSIIDSVTFDMALNTNYQSVRAGLTLLQSGYSTLQTGLALSLTTQAIAYTSTEIQSLSITSGDKTTIAANLNLVSSILNNGSGVAPAITWTVPSGASSDQQNAMLILQLNKTFIEQEITAYISANNNLNNYPKYNAQTVQTLIGYVIDAITYDVLYGGNSASYDVALSYYVAGSSILGTYQSIVLSAYAYLTTVLNNVVTDTYFTPTPGNIYVQDRTTYTGASSVTSTISTLMAAIIDYATHGNFNSTSTTRTIPTALPGTGSLYNDRITIINAKSSIIGSATAPFTAGTVTYYINQGGSLPLNIEMAGNRSMLANDYTQVNDLGYGIVAANNGLTEQVSTFTYYCYTAYWSFNGGQIRSIAGSNSNGIYGLRSSGYDLTEVPNSVTLAENMVQTAHVYKQGVTINQMTPTPSTPALSVWISGYSYKPFNNSEIEIDHSLAGGGITRYLVASITHTGITYNGQDVLQLNFSTSGLNSTSITGLAYPLYDGQLVTIRILQNIKILNIANVRPIRPSTALQYTRNLSDIYRIVSYGLSESTGENLVTTTPVTTATVVTGNGSSSVIVVTNTGAGAIAVGQIVSGTGLNGSYFVYNVQANGGNFAVTLTAAPSTNIVGNTLTFSNQVATTSILQTDSTFNYYLFSSDSGSVTNADPTPYATGYAVGTVQAGSGSTSSSTFVVTGVTDGHGNSTAPVVGQTIGGLGFTSGQTVSNVVGTGPYTITIANSAKPSVVPAGTVYFSTLTQGAKVGDNKIAITAIGQNTTISQIKSGIYLFGWGGRVHRAKSYTAPILAITATYVSTPSTYVIQVKNITGTFPSNTQLATDHSWIVSGGGFSQGQYVVSVGTPTGIYTPLTLNAVPDGSPTANETLTIGTPTNAYITIDPNPVNNNAANGSSVSAMTYAGAAGGASGTTINYITFTVPNTSNVTSGTSSNWAPALPPVDSFLTVSGQTVNTAYNGTYQVSAVTNSSTLKLTSISSNPPLVGMTITSTGNNVPINCIIQSVSIDYSTIVVSPAVWLPGSANITGQFPVGIASISVNPGQTGVFTSGTPTITITDTAGGTGAQATAVITNNQISKIVIVSAGSGYTSAGTISVAVSYGQSDVSFTVTLTSSSIFTATLSSQTPSTQVTLAYPTSPGITGVATATAISTNYITVSNITSLSTGQQITFFSGTSFGGLSAGVYYILSTGTQTVAGVASNYMTISTTSGGSSITLSNASGLATGGLNYFVANLTYTNITPSTIATAGSGPYTVTFTIPSTALVANTYYTVTGNSNPLINGTWQYTGSSTTTTSLVLNYTNNPGTPGSNYSSTSIVKEVLKATSSQLGLAKPFISGNSSAIRLGYPSGSAGQITVNISTTRATGHDFLDIGTGGYNTSNYPQRIYGAPTLASDATKQVLEETVGRVFYVTTDENGIFKVGRFFEVDQGTGTVTFSASIALSNLDGLGFKKGVAVNEFSTDSSFSDNSTSIVPVQSAIQSYVDNRLGITRDGGQVTSSNSIGPGFLPLDGRLSMKGNLNMAGLYTVSGLASPVYGTDAANKQYIDNLNTLAQQRDVLVTSPVAGNILVFDTSAGYATTVSNSGNTITLTNTAGLAVKDNIYFTGNTFYSSGSPPLPMIGAAIITAGYISGNVLTVTAVTGTITVNMLLTGIGVSYGTTIQTIASGSGGVGTYTLNINQTLGSSGSQVTLNASTQYYITSVSGNNITISANLDTSDLTIANAATGNLAFVSTRWKNIPLPVGANSNSTRIASGTGSVATLVIAPQTVNPYAVGQSIIVGGITPLGYNGIYTVTDSNQISFSSPGSSISGTTLTIGSSITYGVVGATFGSITGTNAGAGSYSNVSQKSTSGSGSGATFNITTTGSGSYTSITTITVYSSGSSYALSDTITLSGLSLGGASPANDLTFTISSVPSLLGMTLAGGGLTAGTYYITSAISGSGAGSTWTINSAVTQTSTTISGTANYVRYANTTTGAQTIAGTIIGNQINSQYNPTTGLVSQAVNSNSIIDSQVSTTAAIQQSKLLMQLATASSTSAPTGIASVLQAASGLSSFNSNVFTATNGWIDLANSTSASPTGIQLAKIQYINPGVLIGNKNTGYNTGGGAPVTVTFADVVTYGNGVANTPFVSSTGGVMTVAANANTTGVAFNGVNNIGKDNQYNVVEISQGTKWDGTGTGTSYNNASNAIIESASDGTVDVLQLKISTYPFAKTDGTNIFLYQPGLPPGNAVGSPFITAKGTTNGTQTTLIGGILDVVTNGTQLLVKNISTGAYNTPGTIVGAWTLTGTFQATYADLAENYEGDQEYESGTVLVFGGDKEVTTTTTMNDTRLAGVVTTNPAYTMNAEQTGIKACVALAGRVPCKVVGRVKKGDMLTTSATPGYAVKALNPTLGSIIGKALEDKDYGEAGIIEVAVGRN